MDYPMEEYTEISTKADEQRLSYEELSRLNELHVSMLRKCYESFKSVEEEQEEMQETLNAIWQAWYNNELMNAIHTAFIQENEITEEFEAFLKSNVDQIEKKTFQSDGLN